ncbi:MAG: phosphate/phosphite/phosphonate ABC transporter substrate-binding protein, partial [Nitrospirae bacterium]|nr:phosphate/phosphite/phosphonate ABC transporter substrate-binding protein [Nitrospirota bacterium]
ALNMNVKIKLLDSYDSIYDEIRNKTIDAAFFGSFNYIMTKARGGIEPVARPVEPDGNSDYRGIIIARKDKKLTGDVQKWKGKSIAFVHEVTTAGYIFPLWYLKKNGVNDFKEHFGRIVFTGSHDAAILAVLKGQADIGAAKDLIFKKLLSENPLVKNEIVVIASSISVPSNSFCVRSNLSSETKNSIRKVLLTMHATPDGKEALKALGAIKFKETEDSEFDSLRKMAADLGINAGTYPFRHKR